MVMSRRSKLRHWLILTALLACAPLTAQTTDADIDAVQRKLDEAKRAQAVRDAKAKREAEQRAAREAADRQAEARKGALIVKSDTRCELIVNGESQGWLEAEATQRVRVDAGEQLIECAAGDGRRVEQTAEIDTGKQSVVRLTMPPLERFSKISDGVVDREQQLVWASAENGSDIKWGDAQRFCAAKGSDWTLPSVAALLSLYDLSGAHRRDWKMTYDSKTYDVFAKPITTLIQIGSCCFWSNEPNGSSEAWTVRLSFGDRYSSPVDKSNGRRALCVRRS